MSASQHFPGGRPAHRTIFAATLCLSGLWLLASLSASPSRAEDATPAAQSQIAAPAPKAAAPAAAAPAAAAPLAAAPANSPAAKLPTALPAAAAAPAAAKPTGETAKPLTNTPLPTSAAPAALPAAPGPSVPARLLPHELSPWGMFLSADIVVKVVMVGLAFASVVTWTVWLAKSIELFAARRRARTQLAMLAEAESLAAAQAEFAGTKGAVAQMVAAAAGELERSADLSPEGIKERAAALIARIEARAGRQMNRGTGALATIGATAPFIGLFGTVWGIMNSFIGISKTNATNLAVVAPGIAEALLATALGLVAAIPAVMIYNVFARSIASYRAVLGDAAAEILRHLSRDLDRAMMEAAEEEGDWRVVGMRQSAE